MALRVNINKRMYKNRKAPDTLKYIVTANWGRKKKHVACCSTLEDAEKQREKYLANAPEEEEPKPQTDPNAWLGERSKLLNIDWRNTDAINQICIS